MSTYERAVRTFTAAGTDEYVELFGGAGCFETELKGSAGSSFGQFDRIECRLQTTAATGSSPTLDLKIECTHNLDASLSEAVGTNWFTILTFTQATGVTQENEQAVRTASVGLGVRVRAHFNYGGTSPAFTGVLYVLATGG